MESSKLDEILSKVIFSKGSNGVLAKSAKICVILSDINFVLLYYRIQSRVLKPEQFGRVVLFAAALSQGALDEAYFVRANRIIKIDAFVGEMLLSIFCKVEIVQGVC